MPGADRDDDAQLWRRVTEDVRPLRSRRPPPPPTPANADASVRQGKREANAPQTRPASALPPGRFSPAPPADLAPGVAAGLDKRTLAKLRRGLIAPERRIDLHNMTQSEAHPALNKFLASAQAAGKRCVLVITGKGTRADGSVGVLRANVPHWLNQPGNRTRILAFTHAAPGDGGEGALYVLLRRLRS